MKRVKLLIGALLSAGLLAYLLVTIDMRELATQLQHTRWGWALLSMACALAGLWARAIRWRYLFPPRSEPRGLLAATLIGYMANNVLPLRAGELVRVYVAARRWAGTQQRPLADGFWTALATLILERVLDSLALVCVLAALVLVVPVPPLFQGAAVGVLILDAAAVGVLVVLTRVPDTARRIVGRLLRRWPATEQRAARTTEKFLHGLDGIRTPSHAAPLAVWTGIVWVFPALAAWTMLRAANLDLPWIAGWTVLAFVGLSVSVPSAPGYVGVFHYAAALAVSLFGISPAARVGFALLFHAGQVVPITVVGWIALMREDVSLGEATHGREIIHEAAREPGRRSVG